MQLNRWTYTSTTTLITLCILCVVQAFGQQQHQKSAISIHHSFPTCVEIGKRFSVSVSIFDNTLESTKTNRIIIKKGKSNIYDELVSQTGPSSSSFKTESSVESDQEYSILYLDSSEKVLSEYTVLVLAQQSLDPKIRHVTCSSETNGSISLNEINSESYKWSTGQTTSSLSDLTAGQYSVTITNDHGCERIADFIVEENLNRKPVFQKIIVDCDGQSITYLAGSFEKTNGMQFDWNVDGLGDWNNTHVISIPNENKYRLNVKFENGCENSFTIDSKELKPIMFHSSATTIYSSDKINESWYQFDLTKSLDPQFGDLDNDGLIGTIHEVSFYNSVVEAELGINALNTNFYSEPKTIFARLQSSFSCFDVAEVTLEVSPKTEVELNLVQDEVCDHEEQILLSGGLPTGGKYMLTDCGNGKICPDNAILFDEKTGDYYFNTSVGEGIYHIEYQYINEAGVTNSDIDLLAVQAFNFDFFPLANVVCNGGDRIEIATVPAGQIITGIGVESETLLVDDKTITAYFFNPNGLDEGSYEINSQYVFNSNTTNYSCTSHKSKFLNIVSTPIVEIISDDTEFCHDSNIRMTCNLQNGGRNPSYEWFGPKEFYSSEEHLIIENATHVQSGTYYLEVTNDQGCTIQDFIDITIKKKMELEMSEEQPISCFGASDGKAKVTIKNGSGKYSYLWDNGATTAFVSNLSVGIHKVTITDELSCTIESSIGLFEPEQFNVDINVGEPIACFGASNGILKLKVSGGTAPFDFKWSNETNQDRADNLNSGLYEVTVTDANLCVTEESYFLEQPQELAIEIVQVTHLNCFGDSNGSINIEVIGGTSPYTVEWATGETQKSISSLPSGEHLVIVKDAIGCNTARIITIEEPEETIVELQEFQAHLCGSSPSGQATLAISGPSTYQVAWDNGETGLTAEALTDGLHEATISDQNNCKIVFEIHVDLQTNMDCEAIQLSPASCQTVPNGVASASGDDTHVIVSYDWDNGESSAVASALSPGIHTVTLTDENGCTAICEVTIDIAAPLQLACNNIVNYSLPGNCQLNFTPALVVENYTRNFEYSLSLKDADGNEVDTLMIKEYVGQTLDFVITETCKRSSCWGKINLEDKLGPVLECTTKTIDCVAHMTDFSDAIIPLLDIVDHWLTDGLDIEARTYSDCSLITMQYKDDVLEKTCDNPFSHIIKRHWTARDEYNNSTSCTQQINIYREDIEVLWPADTTYVYCLYSDMNTEVDEDMSPEILGTPHEEGMAYNGDHPSPCTTIDYVFSDQLIETCTGKYKLLREWVALQHCSDFQDRYTQTIHVISQDFDLIQQDTIVKIKSGFDCKTDMLLPITTPNYCSKFTSYVARIYSEAEMEACEVYLEKPTTQSLTMAENNILVIPDLELGCNYIEVYLTTDCHDSDTLSFYATVIDRQAPVLICDAETVVSLGSNGIGFLTVANIDNGSWDNCGIDKIHLTKQDSICALDSINIHSDKVSFCCEEAWTEVTVIMTVTDFSHNISSCKVNVSVKDNAYPHIDCPDDLKLSCTTDLTDLTITGSPISEQLCKALKYFHIDSTEHHECKNQRLERHWYAIIGQDTSFVCVQSIDLFNENPFTEKNIEWPVDVELEGCTANISVEYLGKPVIDTLDGCELIATNFIDKEFDASLGSCISILREWTIIDWCQFNEKEDGIWRNSQVIKIHDKVIPQLVCVDHEVCIEDRDCIGEIDLIFDGSDDCTSSELLLFRYDIDVDSDGVVDYQLEDQSNRLITDLPKGDHKVNVYVEDLCENISHCVSKILLTDCKAPTPYCIAQTVSAIFDENDQTEIWANDFNLASRDNCTPDKNLSFSFEKDSDVLRKRFNCEDIVLNGSSLFSLSVWIKDEAGNQDACYVKIRIDQNESRPCDGIDTGNSLIISGRVLDVNEQALQNYTVSIKDNASAPGQTSQNISQGSFEMKDALIDNHYEISFSKEDDFNAGISTADMIALQNHLMGLKEIKNVYNLLAADVNRDGRLSTADLLLIKKIIIGQISSFPAYESPWVFESQSSALSKLSDVEFLTESMNVNLDLDFSAYKIGDVDGSANRSNLTESEVRYDDLKINESNAFEASLYPNPMLEESTLSFYVRSESQAVVITIIDSSGKIIWREARTYDIGQQKIKLSESKHAFISDLNFVLIEQGQYRESIKLVKL